MGIEHISFPDMDEDDRGAYINEAQIEVYAERDIHLKGVTKQAILGELSRIMDRFEHEFADEEDAHGPWIAKISIEMEPGNRGN